MVMTIEPEIVAGNTDLQWAARAYVGKRAENYRTFHEYLDGNQPLALSSAKFGAAFGSLFRAFAYNRCPNVVDAHADALQITGFHAEGAGADALVQAGADIWDANDMDERAGQVHAEAAGMADGYLLVDKHPVTGDIQYWPQCAADIRVRWSEDVPNRVELAVKRWVNNAGFERLNLYYTDRIEKYIGSQVVSAIDVDTDAASRHMLTSGGTWRRYQGPLDVAWPVQLDIKDTVPVFHFGNNAGVNSYGRSELADVLPLQDGMNKALADLIVAEEFAAYAQRVLLNVDDSDPETQAAIKSFQLGIDRLLALSSSSDKGASIAEFSAAQMAQFELVVELYERLISRVSAVPLHYLTQVGSFASGRAMRLSMTRWISKIQDRQRAFGAVWAEVQRYGVRLALGVDIPRGYFDTKWASAAPMGEEDLMDVALQKRALGYPLEAVLEDMGLSPDRIAEIQAASAEAADRQAAIFARGADPTTDTTQEAA